MNPFDSTLFTAPDCLPCCAAEPQVCSCALLIPPYASPYADLTTAETAITDNTDACIAYYEASTLSSLTASFDGTTLVMDGVDAASGPGASLLFYASVSLLAGQTLSAAYVVTTDGSLSIDPIFTLYRCDAATVVDTDTDAATSGTLTVTADVDGEYYIFLNSAATGATNFSMNNDITCSGTWWVNPVIAQWDDSGTTRSLWACPKLLLPPLTESTGTWYADATAAASAITNQTSNCDGYIESLTNVATFTATDGGTSLTLANTLTAGAMTSPRMWGGINAVDAATLTVTGTVGAGTVGINVGIYDDTGTLVESSGATTSPWTSAALPYTGRYTIGVTVSSSSNTTSMSGAITSSGTISVNPVQARYDLSLVCAATDDC